MPKKYYPSKIPNFGIYRKKANEYLDLEEELHELQRKEKILKKRIYLLSNKMAKLSGRHLQLLGHRVVDRLRKRRHAKRTDPNGIN